ncbi:MAG: ABC transporter ATP-binding protein [Erysipelotrichaceae bacterium]|nr:ABC transporter ATP-binding protein [Erysipelotrichaceae bacterium]
MSLIELREITKMYGELKANDKVSLELNRGEILAVVGENGAGKSTLMKILYGLEQPTSGDIFVNGEKRKFHTPHDAIASGIGMVQQHFMLIEPFTVAENIVYSKEPRKGIFFDRNQAVKITEDLCNKYKLYIDPKAKVANCPVGLQQRIEILKVLYQQAEIIIFDEPSAVLTPQETNELLQTIKDLAAIGKSIILITHKLNEVFAVADRVVVMRLGKVVGNMPIKDTSIEELSFLMVGRQLLKQVIPDVEIKDVCLDVRDLYVAGNGAKNAVDGISMHVNRGEIVGIAGVSGNGQSELIRAITGLLPVDGGNVVIEGRDVTNKSPKQIRDAGLTCIPEDRYLWGSAREATLEETCIMGMHNREPLSSKGILHKRKIHDFVEKTFKDFDVRYMSANQRMGELSGGNAQKVVLAREVVQHSPLLIAAEPTRGLDVGAIEYVHQALLDKKQAGDAVLLVSSELSEVMSLSDRIYVLYNGQVAGEFNRNNATEEKLGILMMGGKSNAE